MQAISWLEGFTAGVIVRTADVLWLRRSGMTTRHSPGILIGLLVAWLVIYLVFERTGLQREMIGLPVIAGTFLGLLAVDAVVHFISKRDYND